MMMGDEAVAEAEDAGRPEAEEEPEGTTPWRPHMPGDVKKHEERDRFDKGRRDGIPANIIPYVG